MRELGFGPDQSVFIGDSDADMGAAAAAGVAGLRVAIGGKSATGVGFFEAAERACALLAERENGQTPRV